MSKPLIVIDVVGLTMGLLKHAPNIAALAKEGFARPMGGVLPAVTCTAQATMQTGLLPREHGIVANGWYFRDTAEVRFWLQSNHLMHGERVYQAAKRRDPKHATAKMFWWYNMYAPVDYSMTPRPSYPADGRKVFDSYSHPPELRDLLQTKYGKFPLLKFWGPGADIDSSWWISSASLEVFARYRPSLTLVYLPHLDYNLQRLGPSDPRIAEDVRAVDALVGKLIKAGHEAGAEIVVLSEYGITEVDLPVHINRILREHGLLTARLEPLGWETLDAGASAAFAVADHQVAHVYVREAGNVARVKSLLEKQPGIERVLDRREQAEFGLDHQRSGELIVIAAPGAWFTYYFWLDDRLAPDYARTVDIHRKPGYDPVELTIDADIRLPKLRIARRLLQKKLGLRYYMDVIGLDAKVVKGSHGRLPTPGKESDESPIFVSSSRSIERDSIPMKDVKQLLLDLQFGESVV
jgi:predicted AlkP superfamily pyrophosphatase or phosphodiesterase